VTIIKTHWYFSSQTAIAALPSPKLTRMNPISQHDAMRNADNKAPNFMKKPFIQGPPMPVPASHIYSIYV